jgi:hypothetical protein
MKRRNKMNTQRIKIVTRKGKTITRAATVTRYINNDGDQHETATVGRATYYPTPEGYWTTKN